MKLNTKSKKNFSTAKTIMLVLVLSVFASSCKNNKKQQKEEQAGMELTGIIEGYNGTLTASVDYGEKVLGTVEVKDGKFSFNHDFSEPTQIVIGTEDRSVYINFWAENAKMTLNAKKETIHFGDQSMDRYVAVVTGGEMQAGADHYSKASEAYSKTHPSEMSFYDKIYSAKTEEEKKELEEEQKLAKLAYLEFQKNYIKENPTNPYCAQLIYIRLTSKTGGESAAALKEWADPIDANTRKNPFVAKMFKLLNTMLDTEAGLDKFVAGVHNVKYKVDNSYKGATHKNVIYLSMMNDDHLCALVSDFGVHDNYNDRNMDGKKKQAKNFFVQIIDPNGNEIKRFDVKANGLASCIAVDDLNNIYVLSTLQEVVDSKFRGRTTKFVKNVGAECLVYNTQGEQLKRFELEGREYATGARIYNDKLLVSDVGKGALGIYSKEDGKLQSTIDDLRPCCSILDFDVDRKKGHVLAANLGSFRVDAYDLTGKKVVSFGKRGRSLDDFHSCCNPVSVRRLDNGAVITVEKSPTRIKVYTEEGAKMIDGIEELVEGCFHIPVMSDSKSNIYLASPEKGLVKCIVM